MEKLAKFEQKHERRDFIKRLLQVAGLYMTSKLAGCEKTLDPDSDPKDPNKGNGKEPDKDMRSNQVLKEQILEFLYSIENKNYEDFEATGEIIKKKLDELLRPSDESTKGKLATINGNMTKASSTNIINRMNTGLVDVSDGNNTKRVSEMKLNPADNGQSCQYFYTIK